MKIPRVVRQTYSLCPICMKRIAANYVAKEKEIFLEKQCPEHGLFSTIVWRGYLDFKEWQGKEIISDKKINPECPKSCGICASHIQGTCCVVLEVTKRCNLNCMFCFAEGDNQGNSLSDPSLAEIKEQLKKLTVQGKTLVQLSGGEPTMREDLPEIIRGAKEAGCQYVQLNSNGIRLAEDLPFVKKLAEAGLSFVFMQFDGTEDKIYKKLRNKELMEIKKKAIENCGAFNIGVTLVPTIVPGVNTENIGSILEFAINHSPEVRGVHFQPSSFFGRVPTIPTNEMRVTLDELLHEVVTQSNGMIKEENLLPSCCDHPLCGFHGDFVVTPEGKLKALTHQNHQKKEKSNECCTKDGAEKNRSFVSRRWLRESNQRNRTEGMEKSDMQEVVDTQGIQEKPDMQDLGYFLKRVKSHGFTITSMVFQDAGNIDLKRLRQCSLHVFKEDYFVPFCANYLTRWNR